MYVRSHVDSNGHSTRTPQTEQPNEAIKQIQDKLASLSDSAKPAVQWLEDSVRRRPGTAVAIAAGLGALVAIGLRRLR